MQPDAADHPLPRRPGGRRLLRPPAQNPTVPNKSAIVARPSPTPVAAPPPGAEPGLLFTCPRAGRGEGKRGLLAGTSALSATPHPNQDSPLRPLRPEGGPFAVWWGLLSHQRPQSGLPRPPLALTPVFAGCRDAGFAKLGGHEARCQAPRMVPRLTGACQLAAVTFVLF